MREVKKDIVYDDWAVGGKAYLSALERHRFIKLAPVWAQQCREDPENCGGSCLRNVYSSDSAVYLTSMRIPELKQLLQDGENVSETDSLRN